MNIYQLFYTLLLELLQLNLYQSMVIILILWLAVKQVYQFLFLLMFKKQWILQSLLILQQLKDLIHVSMHLMVLEHHIQLKRLKWLIMIELNHLFHMKKSKLSDKKLWIQIIQKQWVLVKDHQFGYKLVKLKIKYIKELNNNLLMLSKYVNKLLVENMK